MTPWRFVQREAASLMLTHNAKHYRWGGDDNQRFTGAYVYNTVAVLSNASTSFSYILHLFLFFFFFFFFLPLQHKGSSCSLSAKSLICRVPSSVEAINHELENVFIRHDWEHGLQVNAHWERQDCYYHAHTLWMHVTIKSRGRHRLTFS